MKLFNIFSRFKHQVKEAEVKPTFFTRDHFVDEKFLIGEFTYGKPLVLFQNKETNLIIGKFCSIAEGVTIFLGGNHRTDWISTYPFNDLLEYFPDASGIVGHPATKGDVKIGNDVWIGRNATILSGVKIGNGAVVAAEAVITKNIGPYEIWAGNPARLIKKRFSDDLIENLENYKWWDLDISEIVKKIPELCSTKINLKNGI